MPWEYYEYSIVKLNFALIEISNRNYLTRQVSDVYDIYST